MNRRIHSILVALLVLLSIIVLVATVDAAPKSSSTTIPRFNPSNKRHAVSRSSYHTDAGRHIDTSRPSYPGQGESHKKYGLESADVPLSQGRHLWEDDIYAQMQSLSLTNLGSHRLPTQADAASGVPEQVKLSVTARDNELVVNWLTWNLTETEVQFGTSSGTYTNTVTGDLVTFVDPNSFHLIRYIHNTLLTNLTPNTEYYYIVGDPSTGIWSPEMHMQTPANGQEVQTIAVYGDLGLVNSQSMQLLSQDVSAGNIALVLHLGDYGYNMDELQGLTGDVFLNELQNITSQVPFQGCPGNHEQAFNFSHFKNKFSSYNYIMNPAGPTDNTWWYSWDFMSGGARAHFITIDSELYYWNYFQAVTDEQKKNFQSMLEVQWNWIVEDVTTAYDSGNYDWIFAYSHRPFYCSNVDDVPDCTSDAETLRKGILQLDGTYKWGIEVALSMRPIDIYFSAHEHSYERTLPVKNGVIDTQQTNINYYTNPLYPVQIITGSGGCREFFDYYDEVFYGAWSVFRSATYGYGHLTIVNATHLYWDQLIDEGKQPRDTMWIQKESRQERMKKEQEKEMKVQQHEKKDATHFHKKTQVDLI